AFTGRKQGRVTVSIRSREKDLAIEVRDDGIGLADRSPGRLGLEIVETLVVEDLKGEWSLSGKDGTTARITIPLK
ncbi:MAG TPA: ATP-binding protein, partial [Anaerolineae bacterium]|nr:ATP-binding protein [Anaerolineae bacterium]